MALLHFRRADLLVLAGFLGASFAAAAIGGAFTASSLGSWYEGLQKPDWTPSGAVIGTVWTFLYAAMAIAAWLVWRRRGSTDLVPYGLHGLQLALNVTWPALFFGLQNPAAGLVGIFALWAAVLATLVRLARATPVAGALFVPYLVWVTFAGYLNYVIWSLNP